MKKIYIYLVLLATALFSMNSFAQKGNNQIGVGADLSFPTGDFADVFKTGFGGYAKALYGIGNAGQATFTTGYAGFKMKNNIGDFKATLSSIPFLAGYRHHFGSLFAEPQIGYATYKINVKGDNEDFNESDSEGAFTWAIGVGYMLNDKVELGIRYQHANKDESSLGLFGLRIGYNFSLAKK